MSQCEECGATFYSASASWGDRTCGNCLAKQIELALVNLTLGAQRKPMRRSTLDPGQEAAGALHEEAPRRSA